MMHANLHAFSIIFKHLPAKFCVRFAVNIVLSVMVSGLELLLAGIVSLLGVSMVAPNYLLEYPGVTYLLAYAPSVKILFQDQMMLLVSLLIMLFIISFIKMTVYAFLAWYQALFSQNVGMELARKMFAGFLNAPYLWHIQQDLTKIMTDLAWRAHLVHYLRSSLNAISQTIVVLVLLAAVLIMTSLAEFLAVMLIGIAALGAYALLRKKIHSINQKLTELEAEQARITWPAMRGIREVIIHKQQSAFSGYFMQILKKMRRLRLSLAIIQPSPPWLLELAGIGILLFIVFYMRATGADVNHISSTLAILFAVCWRFLPSLNKAVNALLQMQSSLTYLERIMKRLDDVGIFNALEQSTDTLLSFEHSIQLHDVSFRYPQTPAGGQDVLHHVNITIDKGTTVGFIGLPGSGKSTITGLLAGLFAPDSGTILIDGQPLAPSSRSAWTNSLGYVPQAPFILHDTIATNVAFSRWGQPVDEARVMRACQISCMDFLNELPEGIYTVVGENGVRLSGGQIQKIAIARALYAQPQLIFFDEATNAMDETSEQSILHALAMLHNHATIIIIAHRLSTLECCDVVYWIENGTIRCGGDSKTIISAYRTFLQQEKTEGPI